MLLLAVVAFGLSGCGRSAPFDLAPVSGTITYDDGSLIKASRIQLMFMPVVPQGTKPMPPSSSAEVDIDTGRFRGATTFEFEDGAVVGKHKVTIVAWVLPKSGPPQPSTEIPKKFTDPMATPLEADVKSRGNKFRFRISKPYAPGQKPTF